ncbi:hypothetical protein SAMN05518801_10743 [Novosphingobium sp. CF614]|uniref:hypothetical protein n=1 Tax=Novosphingobium sp. CF614 TaxID=1884364 RepID=UPI0008F3847E|nr:hypothetical protein [Novosphingobium sp. CF614]SFG08550.1 hypothetical protein SAMN05518801_10743 [Novosphingobium sp. CF614]
MTDLFAIVPNWLPGWLSAGAAAGGGFGVIKWGLEFLGGRMDKREAAIDAGTQMLIASLEARLNALTARLDKVETELADCRRKHAEAEAKVMRLEAMQQGYGRAREQAALIVAAERLEQRGI